MRAGRNYDVAVIGAGVFGAWTAYTLAHAGQKVILLDAHGPAHSRASSGGESRIIRMGYGPDELYTRWAMRSMRLWLSFFRRADSSRRFGGAELFHKTGVLWLATAEDRYTQGTLESLARLGVRHQTLTSGELAKRYPQIALGRVQWGLLEPESGALMARRGVGVVVREAVREGAEYRSDSAVAPRGRRNVAELRTLEGERIRAGSYVFACGPWLGKLFPELLGRRIFPTRQEVFYFGVPRGEVRFAPPAMPIWLCLSDKMYGIPDLEGRGFKIALDRHGPAFDPDTGERVPGAAALGRVRRYLERRFPILKNAPVLETRVCQYENTSNGDFLIDQHPGFDNVWLVGGGSGHGFKHGPAVGEYVAARVLEGGAVEPRFTLATKATTKRRQVF